ncbi:MAG: PIN domain-containing protein [Mycobacterium sp.]
MIDTSVYSARLSRRGRHLASDYRAVLEGRPAIISFVTVAEIRFGARIAGWGTARLQQLDHELGRAEIVWPGHELVDKYVGLERGVSRTVMASVTRTTRRIVGLPPPRFVLAYHSSPTTRSSPARRTSN